MAMRRRTSTPRKRREAELPAAFYPRDAHGRFVPLAEYRPRDRKGHFLPKKKVPPAVRALVERARLAKAEAERREAERQASLGSERARKAALALAEKRRRARAALEEERRVRAEEEAREDKKARKKEKRKERRKKEDEAIKQKREEAKQKAIEEAAQAKRDAEAAAIAKAQAELDAAARAEELRSEKERALLHEEEEPEYEPPATPGAPGAPGAADAVMSGVIATPEEIMELALREMRDEAIEQGVLEIPQTDDVLTRNPRTGALGQTVRVGRMIDEEGLAEDLAKIAEDVAELIMGIDRTYVYTSLQLTEWGPAGMFVGSIDKILSEGNRGILAGSWQGEGARNRNTGAVRDTPAKVGNAVRTLVRSLRGSRRAAVTMVEAIYIRGYAQRTTPVRP